MEKKDQIRIVKEMTEGLEKSLLASISDGKIPEEWDGIELRQLFVDTAHYWNYSKMTGKRLKDYRNTVLVKNL